MQSFIGSRPIEVKEAVSSLDGKRALMTFTIRSHRMVESGPEVARERLGGYQLVKAAFDLLAAVLFLIPALPIMLVAALFIKLTSRGAVLYSQVRVGQHGRPFWIYKLRTMCENCEALTGAKWCEKNDPRVTPVGRWLRRLHIDELPQLFNVLRGDMSLVGPRPERPEIVAGLETAIPGYRRRLSAKPGVTGLAQIQLPPDTDLMSVRNKLVLDICYVENLGASLDGRILVGTVIYLFGLPYATVRMLMALPTGRPDDIPIPQALQLS